MIQVLLLLTLLLQLPAKTISKSDIYKRLVKQHKERESIRVSDLIDITTKCELYSYLEFKCPSIEVHPLSLVDTSTSIRCSPVKIGGYSARLTVYTDRGQTWMSMDFEFPTARYVNHSIYDTLLTTFDKSLFTTIEKYLVNEENFSYQPYSPPNKLNNQGERNVYLVKNGKGVSLRETKHSLVCRFDSKKKKY
jgi:hypothetical protein